MKYKFHFCIISFLFDCRKKKNVCNAFLESFNCLEFIFSNEIIIETKILFSKNSWKFALSTEHRARVVYITYDLANS